MGCQKLGIPFESPCSKDHSFLGYTAGLEFRRDPPALKYPHGGADDVRRLKSNGALG